MCYASARPCMCGGHAWRCKSSTHLQGVLLLVSGPLLHKVRMSRATHAYNMRNVHADLGAQSTPAGGPPPCLGQDRHSATNQTISTAGTIHEDRDCIILLPHTCRGSFSLSQGHCLVALPKGSPPSPLKVCQNATLNRSLQQAFSNTSNTKIRDRERKPIRQI
jgi:hypothetical protein